MQRAIILFFAFIILCFSHEANCQYLPIGVLPMEYNPSFAGSVGNTRLVTDFRYSNSKNSLSGDGLGLSFSVDKFIPKIHTGIGIVAKGFTAIPINDKEDKYQYGDFSLIVAPKISIKGKYTISPSIDIDYLDINFPGNGYPFTENARFSGFSGNFGILFNAHNYYIGYALRIFKSDDLKNIYSDNLYSAIQIGYSFHKDNSKLSFTPQLAIPIIGNQDISTSWPSYNLGFRYDKFILSPVSQFDYAYPTGFQLGWQNKGWRLLFSNEFAGGYNNNLTFRYIFNQDKKSRHILKSIY